MGYMDRKLDASQDLLYEVKSLIDNNKVLELRELIEEYHIIDIFDIMENLEEDMKIQLFEVLPLDMASSILEEGSVEFFISILSKLDVEHAKNILELMSLGDMADKLSELEEEEREHIINLLNQENADYVKELLFYDEDSAGGTMTTGYISINKDMTALEAIEHMREEADEAETIYYIYVVDDEEKLVGVLSLRELIISRDANIVEDLMSENIISVYVDEDREEAVRLVSKYNLIAIPVVDRQEKLKGIITVDDIIDVMEEEATEDMYKFAGSSEHEREVAEKENPTLKEQIISALRGRLPWLIITLIGGLLASLILSNLDYIMNPIYAPLVFFIPVVIGMGGNIGTQSSSVTVITLSNKDLNFSNVVREGIVGIITGLLCSVITGIVIYFVMKKLDIVLIVSISLFINMVLGATIGAFMPVLLKKMDADPSTVSSPIISTALDITGIAVYFIITTALLSKIV
ncbi:magnesium transporter [Clostridioides difficile]|nr:magnesium transporter [Clostridioides difficile]